MASVIFLCSIGDIIVMQVDLFLAVKCCELHCICLRKTADLCINTCYIGHLHEQIDSAAFRFSGCSVMWNTGNHGLEPFRFAFGLAAFLFLFTFMVINHLILQ